MINAIIPVWKPVDWTSFDVVKKIRAQIKPAKVGHAGTLDPFAEGVLMICTGKFTKKVESFMNQDKEYLVNVANLNSPNQIVLSGNKQGIKKAIDKCKLLGAKRAIPLPMSVPAHSMLMKDVADKFVSTIESIEFTTPKIPIIHKL